MVPGGSMRKSNPAVSTLSRNQALASRWCGENAGRWTPPSGVAPIWARASKLPLKRLASIRSSFGSTRPQYLKPDRFLSEFSERTNWHPVKKDLGKKKLNFLGIRTRDLYPFEKFNFFRRFGLHSTSSKFPGLLLSRL